MKGYHLNEENIHVLRGDAYQINKKRDFEIALAKAANPCLGSGLAALGFFLMCGMFAIAFVIGVSR